MDPGTYVFYRLTDTHRIPDQPGIYAWYAMPTLGTMDVAAPETVLGLLNGFISRCAPPPLEIEAKTHFDIKFKGGVSANFIDTLRGTAASLGALEGLLRLFERDFGLLGSPIYIGKAEASLRDRIETHKNGIFAPDLEQNTFASRVVSQKIKPEDLRVIAFPLGADLPEADRVQLIRLAERFFHYASQPRLGLK